MSENKCLIPIQFYAFSQRNSSQEDKNNVAFLGLESGILLKNKILVIKIIWESLVFFT